MPWGPITVPMTLHCWHRPPRGSFSGVPLSSAHFVNLAVDQLADAQLRLICFSWVRAIESSQDNEK